MSVEERLRAGLAAEARLVEPEVETELDRVVGRSARRRRRRWVAQAAGAVAVAAAVLTVTLLAVGRHPDAAPQPSDTPPAPSAAALAGEYVVEVASSTTADQLDLTGRWTVTVSTSGLLDIGAPRGFPGATSGGSLRVDNDLVETNVLNDLPGCQQQSATGIYRWRLDGSTLVFESVRDTCPARTVLFAGQAWGRVR